jgi:drug/metabolite transporter (DMT)-like permease
VTRSPAFVGAACAAAATVFFSINDTAIKFLSDGYALHEVVLIRSVIGLAVIVFFVGPFTHGLATGRTGRLPMHIFRSFCVVAANMMFFLGLAALPLAQAVAIFFVAPLFITVLSVIFLKETVGPLLWAAVAICFLGVLIIVRPGGMSFQIASLLPLGAATAYATLHILTRLIRLTESAATMSFYNQLIFALVCVVIGLAVGDGRYGNQSDPSLAFLLRAWRWPDQSDLPMLITIGIGTALGGYLISQAYRVAEAAYVAPFEYLAMPLSVFFGWVVFSEIPSLPTVPG